MFLNLVDNILVIYLIMGVIIIEVVDDFELIFSVVQMIFGLQKVVLDDDLVLLSMIRCVFYVFVVGYFSVVVQLIGNQVFKDYILFIIYLREKEVDFLILERVLKFVVNFFVILVNSIFKYFLFDILNIIEVFFVMVDNGRLLKISYKY